MGLGLVMTYSASVAYAQDLVGQSTYYLLRHVMAIAVGLCAMAVAMFTRIRLWERFGPYLLLIGIVSLVLVLLPGFGSTVNGSTRWIDFGFIKIQPSEFVKLILVIYIAGYLVRKQDALRNFTQGGRARPWRRCTA